jgi:hypothetical protein
MSAPNYGRPSRAFANWFMDRSGGFVRTLGYLMVGLSVLLFAHAKYDEDRGIAAPPYVPTRYTRPIEERETNPKMFRALMSYEWACPVVFLIGGFVLIGLVRRADRCDPFSPSFSGSAALDECERTLDAELRKKHRPLRWD